MTAREKMMGLLIEHGMKESSAINALDEIKSQTPWSLDWDDRAGRYSPMLYTIWLRRALGLL
jgi:hypothetical protein